MKHDNICSIINYWDEQPPYDWQKTKDKRDFNLPFVLFEIICVNFNLFKYFVSNAKNLKYFTNNFPQE